MKVENNPVREIYSRIDAHLLYSDTPSSYLKSLSFDPDFGQYPLSMLQSLMETQQSPKYHPEGSVWNHTLLVTDLAAQYRRESADPRVFMWAALLHDIGKAETTRKIRGRITSYDHDRVGAARAGEFLRVFTDHEAFIRRVSALVRYHMHVLYVLKNLPFADLDGLLRETDVREVALLGLCDRLGRTGADAHAERGEIEAFLKSFDSKEFAER